jgi:DNA primase
MLSDLFASRPSIDYALCHFTGQWPQPNQMIRCPLPGHDDSTPSFNLFDVDADGVPQSFGCFGCGRKGDVISLMALLTGLKGADLTREAERLASGETAGAGVTRQAPKPRERSDFASTVSSLRASVTDVRRRGFDRYMEAKNLGGQIKEFAARELSWIPAEYGVVAVPHWDSKGSVTGIKYRSLSRKWSADGSTWTSLYGAWRDERRGSVLLCEGESDALWASFWLRQSLTDVLALPSGAGAAVTDEWLSQVEGRRLFLAFDADPAGRKAIEAWRSMRPDARIVQVPEGEDLLSSRVQVAEALRSAE